MSCLRTSGRSRSGYAAGPAPPRLRAFWARHAQCVRAAAKAGTGYSEMVEQALMLFIFQQDLGVQLQRALNVEQYDAATRIRERRQKVEEAIAQQAEARGPAAGTRSVDVGAASMDSLAGALALQNDLNEAVRTEDYALASQLRDKLAAIKERNEEAEAAQQDLVFVDPQLRLGQRVEHKGTGMAGVVVGWDRACCEGEEWQRANGVPDLQRGVAQPFYHLVLDARDWRESAGSPGALTDVPLAYAAEEQLAYPQQMDLTWAEKYPDGPRKEFVHPFEYILFLGKDNHGDYLPTKELRTAYNEQRRDVYPLERQPPDEGGAAPPEGE